MNNNLATTPAPTARPVAAVPSVPKPISHTVPGPGTQFSLTEMRGIAAMIAASRQYPNVSTEAQAFSQLLIGQTMGLSTMESLAHLRIIDGKPSLDATLIAAKIKNSVRYDFRVLEHTEKRCELEFVENGQLAGRSSFTMDDAKQAGLLDGKSAKNYERYPRNMLFARAMTNGAKWYCAGVFGGPIYDPDELTQAHDRSELAPPEEFAPTPAELAPPLAPQEISAPPELTTEITQPEIFTPETPTEVDARERDLQRATDLSSALGYSPTAIERSLQRRYNQKSLFDLTPAQLEEYVERLDEENTLRTVDR